MAINLGTAEGWLDLNVTRFNSALQKASAEVTATAGTFESVMGAKMQSAGTKMTAAGAALTKTATVGVLGLGAAAVKVTADFDTGMSEVKAISGATGEELDLLREKAKEMGAKTKFSATESAEAFKYMALAGWETHDMLDGIEGIMNLAAASGEDLASVSDIVTDSLTAFGLEARDANHFADVLAKTMASSNTDVAGLGEAFKYVAPVAGAMGYSIEDVSLALGTMANNGIKSSMMGTALRGAIQRMTQPSEDAAMYMEKFNISLFDNEGRAKTLREVMDDLRGTFSLTVDDLAKAEEAAEMGDEAWAEYADSLNLPIDQQEQMMALTEMFGARAMPGMLAIINASEEDWNGLSDNIAESTRVLDESTGKIYNYQEALDKFGEEIHTNTERFKMMSTAEEMAQTMLDNLEGQFTILKSSLESFALSIGEILMPHIREFVEKIQALVDKFNGLDEEQKKQLVKIALMVAAAGPLLMIIGAIVTKTGMLLSTVGRVPGLFAAIGGGVTKAVTGFKHVGEAFTLARAGMTGFASQTSLLGTVLGSISAPVAAVVAAIGALVAAFLYLWNTNEEFRNNITEIWNGIVDSFNEFTSGIVERINALGFEFEDITQALGAIWTGFCELLAPVFEGAFTAISVVLETVFGIITGLLDLFIGIFTGNWDQAWLGVQEIFGSIWNGIVELLGTVWDTIVGIFDTFLGWIGTSWEELWNNVFEFFSGVWDSIVEFFTNLPTTIASLLETFINTVVEFFTQLPYNVGLFIGQAAGHIAQFAVDTANKALELGKNFIDNVVKFFKELPGKVWDFLTQSIENIGKWVTDTGEKAAEAGSNFIDNVVEFLTKLPGKVWEFLSETLEKIASFVTEAPEKMASAAQEMFDAVVNGLTSLPDTIAGLGYDIVVGLWNGISGMGDWLWNQVTSFANGIVDGFLSSFGIASPSKVMRDKIGKWLPPGISEGFKEEVPGMMKDMTTTLNKNLDKLQSNVNGITIQGEAVFNGGSNLGASLGTKTDGIDYWALAQSLAEVLRAAPIQPQVDIEMRGGDVLLDNERVGRAVAPVVQRVQTKQTSQDVNIML